MFQWWNLWKTFIFGVQMCLSYKIHRSGISRFSFLWSFYFSIPLAKLNLLLVRALPQTITSQYKCVRHFVTKKNSFWVKLLLIILYGYDIKMRLFWQFCFLIEYKKLKPNSQYCFKIFISSKFGIFFFLYRNTPLPFF